MKKIIAVVGLIMFSFYAQAKDTQDAESLEACKEIAAEERVSADNTKTYIEGCLKEIAEDEKRETEEILNLQEKS